MDPTAQAQAAARPPEQTATSGAGANGATAPGALALLVVIGAQKGGTGGLH
jgi:hypothetical protein